MRVLPPSDPDGGVVVADQLCLPGSELTLPCPAAPLLAGSLRRAGVPARIAALTGARGGGWSGGWRGLWTRVPASAAAPHAGPGRALAAAAAEPAALIPLGAALTAWREACGARRVLLAAPRSFCAGVERAIDVVDRLLKQRRGEEPVYVRGQIVHNTHVLRDLEERGARFLDEVDAVPAGATVVFSAHGVSPRVRQQAADRGLRVIDATCPLVHKVHQEARRFAARGDTVALIGHAGHEEVEGTFGEAPERTVVVQSVRDAETIRVPDPTRLVYLTQTTLAVDETADIIAALRRRFPRLRGPGSDDICYATTNRQQALAAVTGDADLVLVAGSPNSSNSVRLVELAGRAGTPAHLVDSVPDIRAEWLVGVGTVGVTAGASAPPALVDDIVTALSGLGPVTVEERETTVESVTFTPPKAVRP